jgi:hypothetical protein
MRERLEGSLVPSSLASAAAATNCVSLDNVFSLSSPSL